MGRLAITIPTLKRLFALSGNECAFSGCHQELVMSNNNNIGKVCHIYDANPGNRFNEGQTDEERRNFDNLMLLCPNHHEITNDATIYTPDVLFKMKKDHEDSTRNLKKEYDISQENLVKFEFEMNSYWGKTDKVSKIDNSGMKMSIDANMTFEELFKEHQETVKSLSRNMDEVGAYLCRAPLKIHNPTDFVML